MNTSKDIRFRVYISFLAMCLFGIMILYKGGVIYFKEGKELKTMADSLHTKIEVIQPERGNIYSEDGSLLSSSIPEFDLRIDMKAIPADSALFTFFIILVCLKKICWRQLPGIPGNYDLFTSHQSRNCICRNNLTCFVKNYDIKVLFLCIN